VRYETTLEEIPAGAAGLAVKVRRIRQRVEEAKRDPWFRDVVGEIVAGVPERDFEGEAIALLEWVRGHVRYLRDPVGLELFTAPATLLRRVLAGKAIEDCDGHVLLASAMLETAGNPTRYVVGGPGEERYSHIWLEVFLPPRGWVPAELVRKELPIGFDPSPSFPLVERHTGLGGHPMNGSPLFPLYAGSRPEDFWALVEEEEVPFEMLLGRVPRRTRRVLPPVARGGGAMPPATIAPEVSVFSVRPPRGTRAARREEERRRHAGLDVPGYTTRERRRAARLARQDARARRQAAHAAALEEKLATREAMRAARAELRLERMRRLLPPERELAPPTGEGDLLPEDADPFATFPEIPYGYSEPLPDYDLYRTPAALPYPPGSYGPEVEWEIPPGLPGAAEPRLPEQFGPDEFGPEESAQYEEEYGEGYTDEPDFDQFEEKTFEEVGQAPPAAPGIVEQLSPLIQSGIAAYQQQQARRAAERAARASARARLLPTESPSSPADETFPRAPSPPPARPASAPAGGGWLVPVVIGAGLFFLLK